MAPIMYSMKATHQSTDIMMETASLGKPTVSRTMTRVTRPACGIPAAPILAAVAVIEIMITWKIEICKKVPQKMAETCQKVPQKIGNICHKVQLKIADIITCPIEGFIPVICAMKIAATAS